MENFSEFGGMEYLLRAYEVALYGGFQLELIQGDGVSQEQMVSYSKKLSLQSLGLQWEHNVNEPNRLMLEVSRPSFGKLLGRFESLQTITERVASLESCKGTVERVIGTQEQELLKNAYDRLNLQPYQVLYIVEVAAAIAEMGKAKRITAEHLAEAIFYQTVDRRA